METSSELQPSGAFHWNKGGWFGALLGGTCWLLILAVLIAVKDPLAGGVIFLCFAAANAVGLWLWKQRHRLRAYPSIQFLAAFEGVCALIAVMFVHLRDAMQHLPENSQVSMPAMYLVLLVYPAIMLLFRLQEHGTRKAQSQGMS